MNQKTPGLLDAFSRYIRLDGTLFNRKKGTRSGSVPHYLKQGVDPVGFDSKGNPENIEGAAMAVEAGFAEVKPPVVGIPKGKSTLLIVHSVCGGQGLPATDAEARMLDELGRLFDDLISKRQKVVLIAAPFATQEQYGMASGRFAPAAIFDDQEHLLWVHPTIKAEGVLKVEWPEKQVCRSLEGGNITSAAGPVASGPLPVWYTQAVAALPGIPADALVKAACQGQANILLTEGKVASVEAGLEHAKAELRAGMTVMGMGDHFSFLIPAPVPVEAAKKPKAGAKAAPKVEPAKPVSGGFGANSDATRALLAPGKKK